MKNRFKVISSSFFLFLLVMILFSLSIDVLNLFNETIFYTFQLRDVLRAKELLQGHFYFYGPEMTGGGNLPGPLYYIFLAFGFLINGQWYSAWFMQYFLAIVAAWCGFLYFRRKLSIHFGLIWVLLLGCAPFSFWFLKIFLNVSSTIVFVVATLILINEAYRYDQEDSKSKIALYWASFLAGVGLQFHLSIFFLYLALTFIQLFSKRLGLKSLDWKIYFKGLILFILPSLPYFIWFFANKMGIHFGMPSFYVGEGGGTFDSLFHLINETTNDSWRVILTNICHKIFFTIPYPLIPLILVFIAAREKLIPHTKYRVLFVCLCFSLVPYLNWYLSPQAIRYTMLFYLCLLFFTVYLFSDVLKDKKKLKWFNLFALIIQLIFLLVYILFYRDAFFKEAFFRFVFFSLLVIVSLKFCFFEKKSNSILMAHILLVSLICTQNIQTPTFDIKFQDKSKYMPSLVEWRKIWEVVYEKTGWTYDEARRKIYFIGHHMSQSPGFTFELFDKTSPKLMNPVPDGFLISNRYFSRMPIKLRKNNLRQTQEWLKNQNLPVDFIQAVEVGDIYLGSNLSKEILIVPYYVKDANKFPRFFHNTGEGYRSTDDDLILHKVSGYNGVVKTSEREIVFKWNECPSRDDFCSTGALVSWDKIENSYVFNVKIVGSALSQISPWISPNWTQAWVNPYLKVQCQKSEAKYEIISSVGFRRKLTHDARSPFFQGNNSFLAPLERTFKFSCIGGLKKISLGRMGSEVDKVTEVLILPQQELSFEL